MPKLFGLALVVWIAWNFTSQGGPVFLFPMVLGTQAWVAIRFLARERSALGRSQGAKPWIALGFLALTPLAPLVFSSIVGGICSRTRFRLAEHTDLAPDLKVASQLWFRAATVGMILGVFWIMRPGDQLVDAPADLLRVLWADPLGWFRGETYGMAPRIALILISLWMLRLLFATDRLLHVAASRERDAS